MTFRKISIQLSCVVMLVCQYSYLIAQSPTVEGWEERINTRQPIQKVIEMIGLKT